ncbi:hypothetical protein THAOC_02659, partial [Thalassiosira oceanica]
EEYFLGEPWNNGRCGGFSNKHHWEMFKKISALERFVSFVEGTCREKKLRIKKSGLVMYLCDSYQDYHRDRAKFYLRILLQLGARGKRFCQKAGTAEVSIAVEHGTCLVMKADMAATESYCTHGVPQPLNRGKITGSSIIIVDLVKDKR